MKLHQLGLILEGNTPRRSGNRYLDIVRQGRVVGKMTNGVWSPRMKANIGFGLVDSAVAAGETVAVQRPSGLVGARLVELPFL